MDFDGAMRLQRLQMLKDGDFVTCRRYQKKTAGALTKQCCVCKDASCAVGEFNRDTRTIAHICQRLMQRLLKPANSPVASQMELAQVRDIEYRTRTARHLVFLQQTAERVRNRPPIHFLHPRAMRHVVMMQRRSSHVSHHALYHPGRQADKITYAPNDARLWARCRLHIPRGYVATHPSSPAAQKTCRSFSERQVEKQRC